MNTLNEAQAKAVNSNSSKILCLAGAGTGKTHCMIERISRLVDEGVEPTSILALTFTNAAAFEMKDRYKKRHRNAAIPEFRTFHSFCYSLLATNKALRIKLGYTSMPAIADKAAQKRIDKTASLQLGVNLSFEKMSGKKPMTALEQYNYQLIKKAAARLMKQDNLITFDELCSSVCQLFIDNDDMIQCYKEKFKYLFVDEFQDTDATQWSFVKAFDQSNIFLVGDAQQAIYAFRGADSSIIKAIAESKEWETIKLAENYRSTIPICEYANRFTSRYVRDSYRIDIQSKTEGDPVDVKHYQATYGLEKGAINTDVVDDIMNLCVISDGGCAVLARTNAEVAFLSEYFKSSGVEFVTGKKDLEAEHILNSTMDNDYMIDWLSTFLPAERYSEYIRQSTIQTESGKEYGIKEFIHDFGFAKAISARIDKIYCIRRICNEDRPLSDRLNDIVKAVGYSDLKVDISKCKKISEFMETIIAAVHEKANGASDIYIGTIHSVKGLEYDNVFVVGVDGRSFRLTNEENNNLFYVAVTRAKKNLKVYVEG